MKYITAFLITLCMVTFIGCSKKQATVEIPMFKSANVNSYLKDYAAYCGEAKTIFRDPAQYSQHQAKMNEFMKRRDSVVKELDGQKEVEAFNKCSSEIYALIEKERMQILQESQKQQAK